MSGRAEADKLKKRLDSTFGRAPVAGDPEVLADFARYLCVLVSGYLESVIVALVVDYAARRSAPEIAAFVDAQLKNWTNPKVNKILALAQSINPAWKVDLEAFIVDEKKESIDSLIAIRHKIAHGESVGTTLGQIKQHYQNVQKVVDFFTELVDPRGKA